MFSTTIYPPYDENTYPTKTAGQQKHGFKEIVYYCNKLVKNKNKVRSNKLNPKHLFHTFVKATLNWFTRLSNTKEHQNQEINGDGSYLSQWPIMIPICWTFSSLSLTFSDCI